MNTKEIITGAMQEAFDYATQKAKEKVNKFEEDLEQRRKKAAIEKADKIIESIEHPPTQLDTLIDRTVDEIFNRDDIEYPEDGVYSTNDFHTINDLGGIKWCEEDNEVLSRRCVLGLLKLFARKLVKQLNLGVEK